MFICVTALSSERRILDNEIMAKDVTVGMKLLVAVRVIIYDTDITVNTIAEVCGVGKVTKPDGTETGEVSFAFTEIDHEDEMLMIPEWEYVRTF